MDKNAELRRIAAEIERCPLCRQGGTGKAVPGEGSCDAKVMFIGEAPGRSEAESGRPFIGRSGKFLRAMIRSLGLEETAVFITSPVHYLPQAGKPALPAIEHGRSHLREQVEVISPQVIVLLGNTACRALLCRNVEIMKEHGRAIEKEEVTYFITFHPAYADRFPDGRRKFTADFKLLKDLVARKANPSR